MDGKRDRRGRGGMRRDREEGKELARARKERRPCGGGLLKEPQSNECKRLHLQHYYGMFKHRVHALSENFLPRERGKWGEGKEREGEERRGK